MTLPETKIGDKGQRYVVAARWSGITREVGYSERNYEAFADAFLKHPSIDRVYVIDRTTGQVVYHNRKGNGQQQEQA